MLDFCQYISNRCDRSDQMQQCRLNFFGTVKLQEVESGLFVNCVSWHCNDNDNDNDDF